MSRTITSAPPVDKSAEELKVLARAALWKTMGSAEAVQLKNALKHHKRCQQIRGWTVVEIGGQVSQVRFTDRKGGHWTI